MLRADGKLFFVLLHEFAKNDVKFSLCIVTILTLITLNASALGEMDNFYATLLNIYR